MSIETDPIPPLPQHTPPVDQKEGAQQRFTINWMQWFTAVREKINVINALIVNFSNLVGTGFPALSSGNWNMRSIAQGTGITVTSGDGVSGDPTIAHADTSSASSVLINNSGTNVLQDVTANLDEFGHVTSITFSSVDVAAALALIFQPLDATLTAVANVTTAADRIIYFNGVDTATATTLTSFIRTLLDDANQAAALSTLGAEATITAGTNAQFYRGDKVMANEIFGDQIITLDNAGSGFIINRYSNDNTGFQIRAVKSRGTAAVPAAIQLGDTLLTFQGRGQTGVATVSGNVGAVQLLAAENFSSTNQGTRWVFSSTAVGSTTNTVRVALNDVSFNSAVDNTLTLGTSLLRWMASYVINFFHSGAMHSSGISTMAALGADVNNWAITDIDNVYIVRASASGANRAITGIAAPTVTNQRIRLINVGTSLDLTLPNESASSTATNRFVCPGAATFTLNPGDSVELWYDNTTARWRVLAA